MTVAVRWATHGTHSASRVQPAIQSVDPLMRRVPTGRVSVCAATVMSVCSCSASVSGNKNKTFKPVKAHPEGMGNRSKLSEYAKATLGSGNMRSAVVLVSSAHMHA